MWRPRAYMRLFIMCRICFRKNALKGYFLVLKKQVGKRRIIMSVDSIGNFLTIIRNGLMVSKPFVTAPYSKMRHSIAQILKEEGFIQDFAIINDDSDVKKVKSCFKVC